MSGLDPSGPAQPSLNDAYTTDNNAASKEPMEQAQSQMQDSSAPVDQRIPQEQSTSVDDATPTSMARGVRGAGAGEDPSTLSEQDRGVTGATIEAEQMRAPGEGEVAAAVESKPGAGGNEPGLEMDLDRKKAEQEPLRAEQQESERREVDVAGVLGQRGGPASTVD